MLDLNRFMVDFILPKGLDEQATNEAGADQFTFQEEVQRSTLLVNYKQRQNYKEAYEHFVLLLNYQAET